MSDIETIMLEAERDELLRRLSSGSLDTLGVIERSFERRALRKRVSEIEAELNDDIDSEVMYATYGYDGNE